MHIQKRAGASGTSYRAIVKYSGRIVGSKTFRLRKDAKAWATRLESDRQHMAALGSPDGARLFKDVAAEVKRTPSRDKNRAFRIDWWTARIGGKAIGRIEVADLRPPLDDYAKDHAPATTNRLRAACSSVFRYAHKQGWITANPARQLAHRTEDNKRVRWLEPDERTRLLRACDVSGWPRLGLLVRLLLGTGCRLGEAMALRWCDVDLAERTAYLERTKNGSARMLTLPAPLVAELKKHRAIGVGLVFGADPKPGQQQRPFTFRKHWNKARIEAGLPDLRLHDLRHDAASQLAMAGATLLEIGEVLGHKSQQTTKRYSHLSVEHLRALTDRVLGGKL
jgi:integrase